MSEAYETDLPSKAPLDGHVQKTLFAAQKHEELMQRLDRATRSAVSSSLSGDSGFQPVRFATDTVERVYPQDLLAPLAAADTDAHEHLRKVLIVLVFLAEEIHELEAIARERFFPALVMFGRSPPDIDAKVRVLADVTAPLCLLI
jgi:hypothetical protein